MIAGTHVQCARECSNICPCNVQQTHSITAGVVSCRAFAPSSLHMGGRRDFSLVRKVSTVNQAQRVSPVTNDQRQRMDSG